MKWSYRFYRKKYEYILIETHAIVYKFLVLTIKRKRERVHWIQKQLYLE